MELLVEALKALGLIVAAAVAVLLVPLVFMIVFGLATGFDERVRDDE